MQDGKHSDIFDPSDLMQLFEAGATAQKLQQVFGMTDRTNGIVRQAGLLSLRSFSKTAPLDLYGV